MSKPGLPPPLSRLYYSCKVPQCDTKPRGCDLRSHYVTNTNWETVSQLKSCVGDAALAELKTKADPHTLFVFENNYTKNKMPSYRTHAQWKEQDDTDRGGPRGGH